MDAPVESVCHGPHLLEEVLQLLPFDTRRKISHKDLAMSGTSERCEKETSSLLNLTWKTPLRIICLNAILYHLNIFSVFHESLASEVKQSVFNALIVGFEGWLCVALAS